MARYHIVGATEILEVEVQGSPEAPIHRGPTILR